MYGYIDLGSELYQKLSNTQVQSVSSYRGIVYVVLMCSDRTSSKLYIFYLSILYWSISDLT
jgi:hypothetical protein